MHCNFVTVKQKLKYLKTLTIVKPLPEVIDYDLLHNRGTFGVKRLPRQIGSFKVAMSRYFSIFLKSQICLALN